MEQSSWWFIAALIVLVVVPLIVLGWLAVIMVRRLIGSLNEASSPGLTKLASQYAARQVAQPTASTERLLRTVIHQQALRCALIGFVTGLAGIFALPIALPVDLYASLRLQATLVHFIASQYGSAGTGEREVQLRTYLVMGGSRAAADWLTKFALTLLSKSLAKTVPLLGAFVSAGVNYAIAQMVGQAALQWYANNGQLPAVAANAARRLGVGGQPIRLDADNPRPDA